MKRTMALLLLVVLLTSMVPPWAVKVRMVHAQAEEAADVGIVDTAYKVSGGDIIINATLKNYGGASGPFNVTFEVFTPMGPPPAVEVSFKWVNITEYLKDAVVADDGDYIENGSAVLRCDDSYLIYKLPFKLNFFGRSITNISVSTNGYIELLGKWEEPNFGGAFGVHMDADYSTSDIIFALDDDLDTRNGYLLVVGFPDRVVVEWFGSTYRDRNSLSNPLNFQVVIFANGTIRWSYRLLEYSSYSYDLFTGYYSKVTGETVGFEKAAGKSFELKVPSGSPTVKRVEVSGMPEGGSTNVSVTLPLGEYYVKIIADDEEVLDDPYRGDNIAELGIWPGDYWVESATIGEVTPGKWVDINFTVRSTSKNPRAVVELLRDGKVEGRWNLYGKDFKNGTASGRVSWFAQGGNYNLALVVRADLDINETNNAYFLGEYNLPLPNFRIANYTIRLPDCLGERALILVNVTNDGGANWSWVDVRASVLYGDNTTVSYLKTISLNAGETKEVTLGLDVKPGNVTGVRIEIDPYEKVVESNESDNSLTVPVSRTYEKPDFTVSSIEVPANVSTGNTYQVNATIENLGGCYAGNVRVNLYENDYYESYAYTTVNGSTRVSLGWTPSYVSEINLTVIVDPYNYIPELNEDNNELTKTVFVSGPDLVITKVTLLNFDGIAGSEATFNVTVKNMGKSFTGGFYVGTRGALGDDSEYISGGLAENESKWVILRPILNGGSYNLTFKADVYSYIPELNESNNEYKFPIGVPLPDFVVTNVSMPTNTVGYVIFKVNITNLGAPYNVTQYSVPVLFKLPWGTYTSYINRYTVGNLFESGESALLQFSVVVYPPGGTVNVTVNSNGRIAEASSDNSKVFNYTTGYPDFVPGLILSEGFKAGDNVIVTVVVFNRGNATFNGTGGPGLSVHLNHTTEVGGSQSYFTLYGLIPPGGNLTRTATINAQGGLNTITVKLDHSNTWAELNESNNVDSVSFTLEKPDFAITGLSVPGEVLNGSAYLWKGYEIRVNVTNLGGDFGGTLAVFLYEDDHYESSDLISGLARGETKTVTLYYYPDPGSHDVTVIVDGSNWWAEGREDNNRRTFQTSFGLPELQPLGVTWEPYNFTSGENVRFTVYTTNLGQAFYRSFSTRLEIWNGTSRIAYGWAYPSDWYFDPNATKTLTWTWYNARPGNLTVKVIVDYYNDIPELNESNNEYTAYLGSIGTPDFELENLSVGELAYGKWVDVNVTLRNLGQALYRPFSVLFNISGELYYRTVYGIGANGSVGLNFRWYADRVGEVLITVKADPGNGIIESDESNNEVSCSYYIEPPDLTISSYEWVQADLAKGYLTYRVNVTNLAGDTYRGFYVALYVDGEFKGEVWVSSLMDSKTVEKTISWRFNVGGTHEVKLVVDPWNYIPESDETNNEVNTEVTIELPDIVVTSISTPEMHANAFFLVNITVRNVGNQDIGRGFPVVVYQDGRYLGWAWVGSLPAGGEANVTVWIRPYPGDSTLKAIADSGNYVVEVNETNNEYSISVHVRAPDIKVVSLSPGNFTYSGETASATVTLRNTGDYETGAFFIVIRNGVKILGRAYAPSIAPGEEKNVTVAWTTDSGSYNLTAVADPEDVIREWDETNNEVAVQVTVPAPDLVVTSFAYSGSEVVGAYINFTVTIKNMGSTTMLPFHVGIYANGTLVAVELVRGLGGGENVTLTFTNAWKARYGTYTLRAVADPFKEVSELDETNNEKNVSVTIIDEKAPYPVQFYPANGSFTNEPAVGILLWDDGSGVDLLRSELGLYLNGNPVNGSSAFIYGWLVFQNSTPLQDGNYTAVATAYDGAGNYRTYAWSFVLDRKAPEIRTNVTDGAPYNGRVVPGVEVIDENLENYTVTVNGRPFTGKAIQVDGTYTLEVKAVDKAGNKAELRVTFTVNGIPHPPGGLTVRLNGSYVELSWLPSGDSDIAGYYVYRDGVRLNDEPVEVTRFRDLYSGSLNYSVTAVDFAGFESEPAYLFPARLTITPGKLVTSYPASIKVTVENYDGAATGRLALELVDTFGNVIERLERGVELLPGNTTETFVATVPEGLGSLRASLTVRGSSTEVLLPVGPTEAGAPEITVHSPRTGLPTLVEVKLTNHGSAPLDTSTATLKLGNATGEPISLLPVLMPGKSATLSYRVVPGGRGTYNLTFRLGGIVTIKEIQVRDPVANPVMLSTEGFVKGGRAKVYVTFRNTGTAPLTVRAVSVLGMERSFSITVPPNLSFSASFDYVVPADAPKEMAIKATVRTDVGDFTRVATVSTEEPPYNANVTVGRVFEAGEEITIEGFAYNASGLLPNVTVRVAIARGDFVREYAVMTDGTGHFRLTFRPYPGEAGHFVVSATHPRVLTLERDAEFDIVGISVRPDVYALRVTREFSGKIEITLVNYWEESNVSVSVSAPAWLNLTIPSILTLRPGVNMVEVALSSNNAVNGTATITFRTTQLGLTIERNLTLNFIVLPPEPIIVVEPGALEVGVVTGETASRSITIKNVGFETLRNVTVESSISWVKVTSNFAQLAPKGAESIALYIVPPSNLTGTFEGRIKVGSSNYRDVIIPLRITVTPNATGAVTVIAMDPNATRLGGAKVVLYNGYAHFEGDTDEKGTITFTDVPIGDYTLFVSKEGYYTVSRKVTVEAGSEKNVTAVLMPSILQVEWEVVPVTIEDVYIIRHEIGYSTHVPAPEITSSGGDLEVYVDYKKLAEAGFVELRGQLIVTNTHPYVSVFNVTFESSGSHYIDVEFAVDRIDELKPGESVVVPYVVRIYYQRSPPMNPCFHETTVLKLKAGVICVEEAGKITLEAQKVHQIVVKPTCEGCLKSLALVGGKVGFLVLGQAIGDILGEIDDTNLANTIAGEAQDNLESLYDAYAGLVMNPTPENYENFVETFNSVKNNLAQLLASPFATDPLLYQEVYNRISSFQLTVVKDSSGNIVGFGMTITKNPTYVYAMGTVSVTDGQVTVDWEKVTSIATSLVSGVLSKLGSVGSSVVGALDIFQLIDKVVSDMTPYLAQAGINCGVCLLHNNCAPPQSGEPSVAQLIYYGSLGGYSYVSPGVGGDGGGGISVGRFTCEGLPTVRGGSPGSSGGGSSTQSCPSCSIQAFEKAGSVAGGRVCRAVQLGEEGALTDGGGGDDPGNTLHMCVDLVITIEQRLTFERQAFRASLKFTNTNANYSLSNVNVSVLFFDSGGKPANDRFFVRLDEESGLTGDTLPPQGQAKMRWLIIPKVGAAEKFRTRYYVMANITAKVGNTTLVYETWPVLIEVEPVPQLELDYVIPPKVYGDDPYTPEKEPPVPFVFGVRVKNIGYGVAKNLRIASAQPRIEKASYPGVYIDFRILGTLVNGRKVPNSLTINFGDLRPGESSTAAWIMSVEVTGDFTYYNATFRHSDELGGNETSLIREVRTHFLLKAFNNTANDDGMLDFLVDDDRDGIPEKILDSSGEDYTVLSVNFTNETGRGFVKVIPLIRSSGWIYMSVPVTGYTRAMRSDGKEPVAQWIEGEKLHILDLGTADFYVLKSNRKPVPVISYSEPLVVNGTVSFDGSLSYDPDGKVVRYLWRIGNETFDGVRVDYTFTEPGVYNVTLTVWDDEGANASVTRQIRVYGGASFAVSLRISPEWGVIPFNVSVYLNVTNLGDAPGTYNATLYLDGSPVAWSVSVIEPGESRLFAFTLGINGAGEHTIRVNNLSAVVRGYLNVSFAKNESYAFSRDFGFYNTTSWEPFRRDFEEWSTEILSTVSVSTEGFDEVFSVSLGNWSLLSWSEDLAIGSQTGWINATYLRTVVIRGLIGYNMTTLYLHQVVNLFAHAGHIHDSEPPKITILYPKATVYGSNVTEIRVNVTDESEIAWVRAEIDGIPYSLAFVDGVWVAKVSIGEGWHELIVMASDVWGNVGKASLNFTVNTSIRVQYINGTEVITIPGELESDVQVSNETVTVTVVGAGWRAVFNLPKSQRLFIDERIFDRPWLLVRSSAELERVEDISRDINDAGERSVIRLVRAKIKGEEDGYAVLMVPRRGMKVAGVLVWKEGTSYPLDTNPNRSVGYYGILGDYVYVVTYGESVVKILMKKDSGSNTEASSPRSYWGVYFNIFEGLRDMLPRATGRTSGGMCGTTAAIRSRLWHGVHTEKIHMHTLEPGEGV
ncbi:CARDB domain-containing protein [Thermococcus waiotapuensis]|uniref:CARDB domain-containing protein n=1 Tax=Thermococcus waiotapuensis TaxID=90909 RepID=A0AAE4NUD9_9EURY|nr:CARDB domain-containing protein [Thermococcus waiotapuensis]MDV3103294.1 CARDB domain-containing protein [Thermococcus waiotapuensis]